MADREKVIKGLECCILGNKHEPDCDVCPYSAGCNDTCDTMDEIHGDAIALLKVQEPRVMTLLEVTELNPYTPIFIQHKSGECGWDIYRGIEDDITYDIVTGSMWAQGEYWYQKKYGKEFVFWTSRPTDAQREAVKWE